MTPWRSVNVVLLIAFAFAAVYAIGRVLFDRPIESVVVEGHLSLAERAAVRTLLTDRLQSGLLSLDLVEVIASVRELSWPQSVAARRVWPSTLVVSVTKQEPVALWGDGRYLTSNGRIVRLAQTPGSLPQLDCARSTGVRALEIYQRLASTVEWTAEHLARVEENALGEWRVRLDSGVEIALGRAATPGELENRLQRYFAVVGALTTDRRAAVRYADARYTNGVALRFETPSMLATGH